MKLKNLVAKILLQVAIIILFGSCAGTIKTVRSFELKPTHFKKALIVSSENSKFIHFKFGTITPFGLYVIQPDDPALENKVIGNTAVVLKNEIEKYGIEAIIGKKDESAENYDFVVFYYDVWRWDFKNILDKLEIVFYSSDGKTEIARSTYNIYKNKELHDFPSPEKEIPKMIYQIFGSVK